MTKPLCLVLVIERLNNQICSFIFKSVSNLMIVSVMNEISMPELKFVTNNLCLLSLLGNKTLIISSKKVWKKIHFTDIFF